MTQLVACCGLVCNECDAFLATALDDKEWRNRLAEFWSKQYKSQIDPAGINCLGCTTKSSVKLSFCGECAIRACCTSKGFENCAHCGDYPCSNLDFIFNNAPEARNKLDSIHDSLK